MPTNKFIQSFLNPVKFIRYYEDSIDAYLSRHMDDYFFYETIRPWQQRTNYYHPWMNTDTIFLQFQSEMSPLKLSLIDGDERVYTSFDMAQGVYDFDNPDLHIYEGGLSLADFGKGLYFLKLECGALDADGNFSLVLISEPFEIAPEQKHTVLLQYSHKQYYNDFAFETGIQPMLRLRATLRLKSLSSKDTFFEDQPLNMTMLQSKPFRVWEFLIGGPRGIPDFLADMINRIVGCSTLLIDGKPYTKADGAKFEESALNNYPMRAWNIDLREAQNITSNIYQDGYLLREDGGYILREDGSRFIV